MKAGALAAALVGVVGCASAGMPRGERDARAALRTSIDSLVDAPALRSAFWGILIVDADRGDTLYSQNAGKLFLPASNMKIVTGAVALATLGPDFRWKTTLLARGQVHDSVLDGDLAVNGTGDPTFSDRMRGDALAPLREMADSLRARGIRRITGRVVAGTDPFHGQRLGFGWSWEDLSSSDGAGVDALFLNDGTGRVIVRGGATAGSPVSITTLPVASYPRVIGTAPTLGQGTPAPRREMPGAAIAWNDSAGAVVVGMGVPLGDSVVVEIPYRSGSAAFLAGLGDALRERGIVVSGAVLPPAPAPLVDDTLTSYQSPPLRDILRAMEKPSQNQIAELAFRAIGMQRGGDDPVASARSAVGERLLQWGARTDGFVLRDGSGLSRYDYLSPETIVHVLAAIRRDTAFSVFHDALPIAGVDGTLSSRMLGTPAAGHVHAKTGSLSNVRALSGYVTTADGRTLIFSLLANAFSTAPTDVTRTMDAIVARLASTSFSGGN